MLSQPVLIFDFDGTLIDSADGILVSLDLVLKEAGVLPQVPLNSRLIGPPLQETLSTLTGVADPTILQAYIESFKRHYDGGGYRETKVYPGIVEMLEALRNSGFVLHLATNKRYAPTQLILDYLGWNAFFQSVHTLDLYNPRLPDKSAMLTRLLSEYSLSPQGVFYVGDRTEDGLAAENNSLQFIGVGWGYGDFKPRCGLDISGSPASLLKRISNA